jgi:hypothetical protein
MSNQLKKWLSAGLAAAAAVLVTLAACDTGAGPAPEAGPGSGQTAGIRSMSVEGVPVQTAAGKINVYVPYYEGFDPKALDVSGEVEEGAAVIPQLTGKQNFSSPKTFSVRSADGAVTKYTVTVYALFSGIESLAKLAAYTDWTSGKVPMPNPEKPLPFYIALEGIDLYNPSAVPAFDSSNPGVCALGRIFGVEDTFSHEGTVPGYTHGQYIALDLSRYTDTVLQGSQLPLGNHESSGGETYYADGPFSRVTSINLPPNLRTLGKSLFQGNEVLTEIELPESLVKIDYAAFAGAKNLKTVKLPSTLKTIETYAFMDTALESIDLSQGLTSIGTAAFSRTSIKRLTLPSSVVSLNYSFSGCDSLEYADLSKTQVEELGLAPFYGCNSLKEVYLPETLIKLDSFSVSFAGTGASLEKMVVYAPFPPEMEEEWSRNAGNVGAPTGPYRFVKDFKIYVPDSSVNLYKTASGASLGWSQYADKIRPISELGAAQ